MSFRRRIALASAAAVAIAVVLASLLTYLLTSNQLHSQVDEQLRNRARTAGRLQRYLKPGRKPAAIVKTDSERLGLDLNGLDGSARDSEGTAGQRPGEASTPRYGPIAKKVIYVDSDGPLSRDYARIPYTKVRRPIWPLDEDTRPCLIL